MMVYLTHQQHSKQLQQLTMAAAHPSARNKSSMALQHAKFFFLHRLHARCRFFDSLNHDDKIQFGIKT